MKKIKMLSSGPNKNYRKGQVVEVDQERAKVLVQTKHAIYVKEK